MQLVLSTNQLSAYGGSETYLVTVAEQLQKLGHGVTVFAPVVGEMGEFAESRGLEVVSDAERLPESCDAVFANDSPTAYDMAARYPQTPQAFAVHADGYEISVPPQVPGLTAAAVVMYDRTEQMAEALSVTPRIVRLSQPVDTDRFAPLSGLHDPPRRALLMGNYVWGDRRELVARACAAAGIELIEAGYRHGRFERDPVRAMAEADIVIGKARVIVEAMAAGRAAYVYDHNGGDGWVDGDRYERLAADNFGGQVDPEPVDLDRLVRDLGAYSPEMGLVNRDLAVRNHSANKHAQALVALFRTLAPRSDPPGAPLEESARLVRRQWAAHGQLHALTVEAQDLRRQLEAAETEKRGLEERLIELQATRRYRLAAALARPLDLLRSR